MRAFIILCFLATSVYAQGYNYGVGQTGQLGLGGGGFSGAGIGGGNGYQLLNNNGGFGNLHSSTFGGLGSQGSGSLNSGSLNYGNTGSLNGGNIGADFSGSNNNNNGLNGLNGQFVEAPVDIELTKEFYTFEAPEQDYHQEHQQNLNQARSSIKKHQKVIFIKTPENKGFQQAAVSLARNAVETQSAIYVLHKQADISALANKLVTVNTLKAAKPEVHFVKYNTAEDAINAQRTIQAQYDSLGGSSVFKNGGVPRVLNFATNYAPAYMTPSYAVGQSGLGNIGSSGGIISSGSLLSSGGVIGNGGGISGSGISTGNLEGAGSSSIGSVSTGGLVSSGDNAGAKISVGNSNGPSQQYLPSAVKK